MLRWAVCCMGETLQLGPWVIVLLTTLTLAERKIHQPGECVLIVQQSSQGRKWRHILTCDKRRRLCCPVQGTPSLRVCWWVVWAGRGVTHRAGMLHEYAGKLDMVNMAWWKVLRACSPLSPVAWPWGPPGTQHLLLSECPPGLPPPHVGTGRESRDQKCWAGYCKKKRPWARCPAPPPSLEYSRRAILVTAAHFLRPLAVSSVGSGHCCPWSSPLGACRQVGSGNCPLTTVTLRVGHLPLRFWKTGIGPEKFQSQTISPGRKLEGGYFSKGSDSHTHTGIFRRHQRDKKASWPVLAPRWHLGWSPSVAVLLERVVFCQKRFFWKILQCSCRCFSHPPLRHVLCLPSGTETCGVKGVREKGKGLACCPVHMQKYGQTWLCELSCFWWAETRAHPRGCGRTTAFCNLGQTSLETKGGRHPVKGALPKPIRFALSAGPVAGGAFLFEYADARM